MDDLDYMLQHLKGWKGQMDGESVPATVYSFTLMSIHKSLFHAYESDPEERIAFTDSSYLYFEFLMSLIKSVKDEGDASKYQRVCK